MNAQQYAELSPTQRRQRVAYMRRWRRGLIRKKKSVAQLPYALGYQRGWRAGRKSAMRMGA